MATPSTVPSPALALQPITRKPPKTKEALRYKCDRCPKAFTRSATLKQHVRKHTGEKPYKCDSCSKTFARLKDKKRHELLHDIERKFVCDGEFDLRAEPVSWEPVSWGCEKKFARKDGLVAHLRSPRDSCADGLAVEMWHDIPFKIRHGPEYLRFHGTWCCSFKGPSNSPDEDASSAGCGRIFEGAQLLQDHISPARAEDHRCWTEMLIKFRPEAIRRALGHDIQIPRSDEQSKKLDSHPLRYQKINVRDCRSLLDVKVAIIQVKLDISPEVEHWKHCAMDFGGIKIADFKKHFEMPSHNDALDDSLLMKYYWLEFTIPNAPQQYQEGGLIRLRGNLEGDCNSYSYDSMILGVFKPGVGELVPSEEPMRAQLQACMDVKSVPVWHDGEEIARFAGEVSVTREEHNLWDENFWDENLWDENLSDENLLDEWDQ